MHRSEQILLPFQLVQEKTSHSVELVKILPIGTSYIFLTTDINYDATLARTISASSDNIADFTITESFTNGTHNFAAANLHTIVAIPGVPTDLIISEYVEGSSFNKYIEVYNGTGAVIDLSDYELRLFSAASTLPTSQILTGNLADNTTIVFKHGSSTLYLGTATAYNTVINYNGDDQVAIFKVSTASYVDIFGRIGTDPGTAWTGDGGYSTENKTLRRKSSVTQGVSANPASGFPTLTTEWDLFDSDNISGLGSHSISVYTASYTQSVATGSSNYNFLNTGLRINFVDVTTGADISVTRYEEVQPELLVSLNRMCQTSDG
ncbi:MAG: lamin tail domain-containing protein [Ignavibacteriales bacterium]|nr:lamin tail domain-containing protein [Ignavibacteriales bacterium]